MPKKSAVRPRRLESKSDPDDLKTIRRQRVKAVIAGLKKLFPEAECALHHSSAFQLLVATILSAQCTDERVNQATPELFEKYPDPKLLAAATQEDVERIVKPLGFFRNKATNIRGMASALVERFDGEIPQDIELLVTLPGVGRKTASVVLGRVTPKSAGQLTLARSMKRYTRHPMRIGMSRPQTRAPIIATGGLTHRGLMSISCYPIASSVGIRSEFALATSLPRRRSFTQSL